MNGASHRPPVLAAVYMIFAGIATGGMWTMFLLTGQVPEIQWEPWRIAMHLAAEFTTAILLLIAGVALCQRANVPTFHFPLGTSSIPCCFLRLSCSHEL